MLNLTCHQKVHIGTTISTLHTLEWVKFVILTTSNVGERCGTSGNLTTSVRGADDKTTVKEL